MAEHMELGQLVKEERHLGRITRIQQLADGLDIGPKDLSQRNLSQARATIRWQRAGIYIGMIEQRLAPISAQIDEQALNLFQNYSSQLRKKETDLRVVTASGVPPFTKADFARFAQEVEDFRQKPTREPLLARGMLVFNRPVSPPAEATSESPAGKQQVKLTYADIDERGVHFAPLGKRLMEVLLPHNSKQDAIPSSDWAAPVWPNASEAERRELLKSHTFKLRRALQGTGLSIVTVKAFRANEEVSFYLKVDEPAPVTVLLPVPSPELPSTKSEVRLKPAPPPKNDFLIKEFSPISEYRGLPSKVLSHMRRANVETRQFLAHFLESEDAYVILNCVRIFNNRNKAKFRYLGRQEFDVFYRRASGYLTEWLAFSHLYPRYSEEGLILLSPRQKFTVYNNAHREKRVMDDDFGLNPEIEGVPSADGLLIKPVPEENSKCLELVSVVECKNVTTEDKAVKNYIEAQRARYTTEDVAFHLRLTDPQHPDMPLYLGRLIHKLTPQLPALPLTVSHDLGVLYVVPIDSPSLEIKHIKLESLPVSTGEIAALIRILTEVLS